MYTRKTVSCAIMGIHYVKCSSSHVQNTPSTMSPELMNIKTKVLINIGTSEMMCVELRAKKL